MHFFISKLYKYNEKQITLFIARTMAGLQSSIPLHFSVEFASCEV